MTTKNWMRFALRFTAMIGCIALGIRLLAGATDPTVLNLSGILLILSGVTTFVDGFGSRQANIDGTNEEQK